MKKEIVVYITNTFCIYADDTHIYSCLNCKSNRNDQLKLAADFENGLHQGQGMACKWQLLSKMTCNQGQRLSCKFEFQNKTAIF